MFLWLHGARGEAPGRHGDRPLKGWGWVSASSCGLPSLPQHGNFEESQETMKRQLGQLLLLLRVLDPQLCDFLGECLCGQARRWGDPPFLHPSPPPTASLWKWPWTGSETFGPDPDKGNIPAKARMQNCHVKAGLWFRAIFSESLSQEWDL